MHIALVCGHADPLTDPGEADAGGVNVHVAQLAAALARRGHRVAVYIRRAEPHRPVQVSTTAGYTVVSVSAGPPRAVPERDQLAYLSVFGDGLGRHWRTDRPDVVHAHHWISGLAAVTAATPLAVPVVQTYHSLDAVERRHRVAADTGPKDRIVLESGLGRAAAAIVATSTGEIAELVRSGVPRRHITVIPGGVDPDRFSPPGPGRARRGPHQTGTGARDSGGAATRRRRVVAVGRLLPHKGFETLIRALPAVPEAQLVIVDGPDASQLPSHAEACRLAGVADRFGVAGRVRLTGRVHHAAMPALLRSADVVACTPWYEPFGTVPLEAMACERPVVAAAVGGLTDTVVDEVTGLLVPPRDPRSTAAALRTLCRDDARRLGLGLAGRQRVRARYTWDRIAADTEAVYGRVARVEAVGAHPVTGSRTDGRRVRPVDVRRFAAGGGG